MQRSAEQTTINDTPDRQETITTLERFIRAPERVIEGLGPEGLANVVSEALELLKEYDSVLQGLVYSVTNGDGPAKELISPEIADKTIRQGISRLLSSSVTSPSVTTAAD